MSTWVNEFRFQWTWANCHSIQQRAPVHTVLYRGTSTRGLHKPAFWTWKILFLPLSNYSSAGHISTPTPPQARANTHRIKISQSEYFFLFYWKITIKILNCLFFRNEELSYLKSFEKKYPHGQSLFFKQ